jgi:hypothetical protein
MDNILEPAPPGRKTCSKCVCSYARREGDLQVQFEEWLESARKRTAICEQARATATSSCGSWTSSTRDAGGSERIGSRSIN